MIRPSFLIAALAAALASPVLPVRAQTPAPARLAVSSERLERVDRVLQDYVDRGEVAGVVALVLRDGKPVYERALGWADKEAGRKMSMDTIFRIASQTKAITSAAALILMEEGKLGIDDPVSRYIPTFAKTTVATPQGPVPAKRPITIRDLITHTAGISYGTGPLIAPLYKAKGLGPAAGNGWYTADKDEPICVTMERLGTLPFHAQPGEAFVYGYNTDVLGCVVEKASGMPLDAFIRERITGPLGMKDTQFFLPPADRHRLATLYASGKDGKAVRAPEGSRGQGHYVDGPRKSFAGGAGLLSTARDYARFLEMIRRGGAIDGVRILGDRTAALMHTGQIGDLFDRKGMGFGFGFQVVERYGANGLAGVGAFGWGGAYGTNYEVDPASGLVRVLMVQLMPSSTDIETKFATTVYQALVR